MISPRGVHLGSAAWSPASGARYRRGGRALVPAEGLACIARHGLGRQGQERGELRQAGRFAPYDFLCASLEDDAATSALLWRTTPLEGSSSLRM